MVGPRAVRRPLRRGVPGRVRRRLALGALAVLLAGSAVAILTLVERQTGSKGFAVGLVLAVLPVPLVVGAFLWLDRADPQSRRRLLFCFAWGAFVSTLVALVANSWTANLLMARSGPRGEMVGSSTLVPLVEESAKGFAVLALVLLPRGVRGQGPRGPSVSGPVGGLVLAGVTASGFAFTENVLYLGRAFASGSHLTASVQLTFGTLFVRAVLSPFAHPLFTCMTGLGLGAAAVCRSRWWQVGAPLAGWMAAMALHGLWNGLAGLGMDGFLRAYSGLMVPVFLTMLLVALWSRHRELASVARHLTPYAGAGWLSPDEPAVIGSMRGRAAARRVARERGVPCEAALREYLGAATELARVAARQGDPGERFEQEQRLLHRMWLLRFRVAPVLARVPRPLVSDGGNGPRRG